ncbi:MAG: gene transfer agent family protein [Pseudomonadota bacterium]
MDSEPFANPHRGEVELRLSIGLFRLRPSFERLVAAEAEVGSIISLLDAAAKGEVRLGVMAPFLWAIADPKPECTRECFLAAVAGQGITASCAAFVDVMAGLLPPEPDQRHSQ